MNEHGKRLLDLLFKPDEEVCVSPNKYGYKSIPLQEVLMGSFVLSPNDPDTQIPRFCNPQDIQLVAVNPIKGTRSDANVTAFRNFMIEMDKDDLAEQFAYVNNMGMPYSACVYSGSKSLHYAISLSSDLPSEEVWRFYMQWILNIMTEADQQAKNPSRSIRFAGNIRTETGRPMKLLQFKGQVDLLELQAWLSNYEGLMPRPEEKPVILDSPPDISMLPDWVQNELLYGINTEKGRNNRWFSIAYQCGLKGWGEDDTIEILGLFFQEERDFSRREWVTAVKSGVGKAKSRASI